jgi:hypothetical protein
MSMRMWMAFVPATAWALLAAALVRAEEPSPDETLRYQWTGGLARYTLVTVTVKADGAGAVTLHPGRAGDGEQPIRVAFRLNADEQEALRATVHSVGFFTRPEKPLYSPPDVGVSILRVTLDGHDREISFGLDEELEPLRLFVWRLIVQAEMLTDVERGGTWDLGAIASSEGAVRVLQPQAFRDPLKKLIRTSQDRDRLSAAVGALSWIMSPDEWMGFLASELENGDDARRIFLLSALTRTSNLLPSYRQALAALLLDGLRSVYRDWPNLSKEKQEAYGDAIAILGNEAYGAALPVLVEMIPTAYYGELTYVSHLISALPAIGGQRRYTSVLVDALLPCLGDEDPAVRAAAAQVLGNIVEPGYGLRADTPAAEQAALTRYLTSAVGPKLKEMVEKDPDEWPRNAAKRALEQIGRAPGWEEPRPPKPRPE